MQKPIRVVHVLGRLDRGGAESMIMNLYRRIDKSKVQFDFILHTEEECSFNDEVRAMGGRIYSVPSYSLKNAFKYKRSFKELFINHPEWKVLHSHVRSSASLYLPIATKQGMVTIVHSHNTSSGKGLSAVVKTLLQYPLRKQADYLFACSGEAGKWLYGKDVEQRDNYYLVKNAIDTKKYIYSDIARKAVREYAKIPQDAKVVGHVGRFETQKNHDFLINVFAKIQDSNTYLVLIGEGVLEKEMRDKVKTMGIENVLFAGVRTNVHEWLSAMDLLLFPSLFEGLPVTLIEAQAAGLDILMSDTVSSEIEITKLVKKKSLKDGDESWAKTARQMLRNLSERNSESKEMQQCIMAAGYDVNETAEWLQEFYFRCLK